MKIVKPYPLSAMILWSLVIGNVGDAYLLIWKNLLLMGKMNETGTRTNFDLAFHGCSVLGFILVLTLSYLVTGLVHIFPAVR